MPWPLLSRIAKACLTEALENLLKLVKRERFHQVCLEPGRLRA